MEKPFHFDLSLSRDLELLRVSRLNRCKAREEGRHRHGRPSRQKTRSCRARVPEEGHAPRDGRVGISAQVLCPPSGQTWVLTDG